MNSQMVCAAYRYPLWTDEICFINVYIVNENEVKHTKKEFDGEYQAHSHSHTFTIIIATQPDKKEEDECDKYRWKNRICIIIFSICTTIITLGLAFLSAFVCVEIKICWGTVL